MKKIGTIESITLGIALLFVVLMSFHGLSYSGFLGLDNKDWTMIWVVCQNGLPLSFVILIGLMLPKIKWLLYVVFIPYFLTRFVFDYTTYLQVYICSKSAWGYIFSVEIVMFFVISLIIMLKLIRSENN